MKLLAAVLACVPVFALADVNFLTTVRAKPGQSDAAGAFLAKTTADFHRIKPAGQTALLAARTGEDQFVVLERYVDDCAAIEWTYNETHVEACKPLATLIDSTTVQLQSDAAPWAIQSFLAFLKPPST